MTTNPPTDTSADEQLLTLPAELTERIDSRLNNTTFESREEYVTEALEQLLTQIEANAEPSGFEPEESPSETEAVKSQLESLGYL